MLLPRALFEALLDEDATFRRYVFGVFAQRFGELMVAIESVAFLRLDVRLARLLLRRGPEVRATHQQLADELGSVREIVSRLLAEFAGRGWVHCGRGRVQLLDAAALHALADERPA